MRGSELVLYRPPADLPTPRYARTAADVAARVEGRVGIAFRFDTESRQAHRSIHELTVSGIGRCLRWAAHTVAGTPRSEPIVPEEAREAAIGTWIHLVLLPLMRSLTPGALIELPVVLKAAGMEIRGTLDWMWINEDGEIEVGDLKTVREWKLNSIDRFGVFTEHEFQVWAYALAAAQLAKKLGLPHKVRWVWWLYLDRSTGQIRVRAEEFTNERAYAVIQRVAEIKRAAGNPGAARREGRGPGLSPMCDGCPWLTECWGPTARRGVKGAQSYLAISEEGIIRALETLFIASGTKSAAEKEIEFAKLVLADVPNGTYRGYTLKRRSTGSMLHQARARARLEALGEPVPMTEKGKALMVSSS